MKHFIFLYRTYLYIIWSRHKIIKGIMDPLNTVLKFTEKLISQIKEFFEKV